MLTVSVRSHSIARIIALALEFKILQYTEIVLRICDAFKLDNSILLNFLNSTIR